MKATLRDGTGKGGIVFPRERGCILRSAVDLAFQMAIDIPVSGSTEAGGEGGAPKIEIAQRHQQSIVFELLSRKGAF